MATTTYIASDSFEIVKDGVSDGTTITLTGAKPGTVQRIGVISVKALGTITAVDISITKNDASTVIAKFGAATALPAGGSVWSFTTPINCAVNDNAIIAFNITGATVGSVTASVHYTISN